MTDDAAPPPFTSDDILDLLVAHRSYDAATVNRIAGPLMLATTTAGALIETLVGTAVALAVKAVPEGTSPTMTAGILLDRVGIDGRTATGAPLVAARMYEATLVGDDHMRGVHVLTCLDDPILAGRVVEDLLNLSVSALELADEATADGGA